MAEWYEVYSKETPPTYEQVEEYVGSPLWGRLNDYLQRAYEVNPNMGYSGCSMQAGWNVKYKKGGKSLCTLYPMEGYYIALVVVGDKEMQEAEAFIPSCSDYVRQKFADTPTGQGQKWLMIDVKEEATLSDVASLVALRVKVKNASCVV